jgi:magnesium-transporting ATPase (P-type)
MIVKILQDQFFPADLILLNSSAAKGIAYIETKSLDGETNLKHKQGQKDLVDFLQGTMARVSRRESQSRLLMSEASTDYNNETEAQEEMIDKEVLRKMKDAYVECENPNDMLYRFEGTMGLGGDKKGALVPLGPD